MDVYLKVTSERANVRTVKLKGDVTIGRGRSCELRVVSNEVSREHCQLLLDHDYVAVVDLNSANGTLVNGRPIDPEEPVLLEAGDEVTVGPMTFTVQYAQPTATVAVADAEPISDEEEDPLDAAFAEEIDNDEDEVIEDALVAADEPDDVPPHATASAARHASSVAREPAAPAAVAPSAHGDAPPLDDDPYEDEMLFDDEYDEDDEYDGDEELNDASWDDAPSDDEPTVPVAATSDDPVSAELAANKFGDAKEPGDVAAGDDDASEAYTPEEPGSEAYAPEEVDNADEAYDAENEFDEDDAFSEIVGDVEAAMPETPEVPEVEILDEDAPVAEAAADNADTGDAPTPAGRADQGGDLTEDDVADLLFDDGGPAPSAPDDKMKDFLKQFDPPQ